MQTLRELKKDMYENIKYQWNDFLSDEEKYIVENLESCTYQDNEIPIIYTEDEAANIVCQSLDWLFMNDTEKACWYVWYIRWYENALQWVLSKIESSNNKLITYWDIEYLLNN